MSESVNTSENYDEQMEQLSNLLYDMEEALREDSSAPVGHIQANIEQLFRTRPSASGWIPVSERLPEKEDYYYVTDIDPKTGERYVEYTYYFADSGFDSYNPQAWIDWYPEPYTPSADGGKG